MIKTKKLDIFRTRDEAGQENGYLVPIYNIHDEFYIANKHEPKQVYMTSVFPQSKKGPHKHFIRQGCFVCVSGNVKVVIKQDDEFHDYFSGKDYDYQVIIVPRGVPALIVNESKNEEALLLNLPDPAWTADMNDEYTEDFSDYE